MTDTYLSGKEACQKLSVLIVSIFPFSFQLYNVIV
jgi:hypothetical protein